MLPYVVPYLFLCPYRAVIFSLFHLDFESHIVVGSAFFRFSYSTIILETFHIFFQSQENNIVLYKKSGTSFISGEPEGSAVVASATHSWQASPAILYYNFSQVSHKGLSVELVYHNFSKQKTKPECILLATIYSSYIQVGRLTNSYCENRTFYSDAKLSLFYNRRYFCQQIVLYLA